MAAPKKPQDHKPKTGTVKVHGIELDVSPEALDDFELLDDLAALQNQDGSRLPSILHRLVGDQFKPVMDALRGENGRVSLESATEFVQELLESLAPNS